MNNNQLVFNDVGTNKLQKVVLNNSDTIKCKRIPLANIEQLDGLLGGLKDLSNLTNSSYMKKSDGTYLSATKGKNGKIASQAGFKETGVTQAGVKAATGLAKAIPWIGLAIMVIEAGVNIVQRQRAIIAEENKKYDDIRTRMEDLIYELWEDANNVLVSVDDAHRFSAIHSFDSAIKEAKKAFRFLENEIAAAKKINERAIYAYKSALDLYSASSILNICFSKVEDKTMLATYINQALPFINDKTHFLNESSDKCYNQLLQKYEKNKKFLEDRQLKDVDTAPRVALAVISGGLSEVADLGRKAGEKKNQAKEYSLKALQMCKEYQNPYSESLETVGALIEQKNHIFVDKKYLYYQVD